MTMDFIRPAFLIFALALPLVVPSCAGKEGSVLSKRPMQKTAASKSPVSRTAALPRDGVNRTDEAVSQAKKYAEGGQYQKAIDIFSDEYGEQSQDVYLRREYVRMFDGIRAAADSRLKRRDLAGSGRLYHILRMNYGKFRGIGQSLSFDDAYLDARLAYCRKMLSRQGFEEYRRGNLNNAVETWQDLLVIDPGNQAVRNALRTAEQQQRNLRAGG